MAVKTPCSHVLFCVTFTSLFPRIAITLLRFILCICFSVVDCSLSTRWLQRSAAEGGMGPDSGAGEASVVFTGKERLFGGPSGQWSR
ncbi:hypothetical protein FN846DRAFT_970354 [Sphaerosporella brunnea]|uniref:Uncharacterized protein n=1 Tax=Sphaerosporella brunnea TaxID=1250544 RepID=A0A5J5EJL9_9PEZI|nr:hypothetical protein FN846DRAFT_970354 [Sphaerosporella brunnea]